MAVDAQGLLVGVWLLVTSRFQPSPLAVKLHAAPRKGEQSVSLILPLCSLDTASPLQRKQQRTPLKELQAGTARRQARTASSSLQKRNARDCNCLRKTWIQNAIRFNGAIIRPEKSLFPGDEEEIITPSGLHSWSNYRELLTEPGKTWKVAPLARA